LKPTNNNERGFTIIEVLIAVVILTVALVALAEMMAITLRMQMLGRNETNAARIAQAKLDELVGVSQTNWASASIAIGGNLDADVNNYNDVPQFDGQNVPNVKRRWLVSLGPTDAGGDAGHLRFVTVRVIPTTTGSRGNATVELTTLLRNPAP
jgi:prepilin-type N-terminal cleavage/methylation domain-containing protein